MKRMTLRLVAACVVIVLLGSGACSPVPAFPPSTSLPSTTPRSSLKPTVPATVTSTPAKETATPQSTQTLPDTPTGMPTLPVLSDPRLTELENNGYVRTDLTGFSTTSLGGSTLFGGPDGAGSEEARTEGNVVYLQYVSSETGNCVLVFVAVTEEANSVIALVDASHLSQRIAAQVNSDSVEFIPLLGCSPFTWGDTNNNGHPDIAVSFMWGNHYTGSELHLFEVSDGKAVVDLTRGLPGIMSPWDFDPRQSLQPVVDLIWANHDCIYPPLYVFWMYDWRDGEFVDVTAEVDLTDHIASLKSQVTQSYGRPLNAYAVIQPLTQLLLIYDRAGQREHGWQEYLDLADFSHWREAAVADTDWLQSDIDHFARQYQAGEVFTPNDYCGIP